MEYSHHQGPSTNCKADESPMVIRVLFIISRIAFLRSLTCRTTPQTRKMLYFMGPMLGCDKIARQRPPRSYICRRLEGTCRVSSKDLKMSLESIAFILSYFILSLDHNLNVELKSSVLYSLLHDVVFRHSVANLLEIYTKVTHFQP